MGQNLVDTICPGMFKEFVIVLEVVCGDAFKSLLEGYNDGIEVTVAHSIRKHSLLRKERFSIFHHVFATLPSFRLLFLRRRGLLVRWGNALLLLLLALLQLILELL